MNTLGPLPHPHASSTDRRYFLPSLPSIPRRIEADDNKITQTITIRPRRSAPHVRRPRGGLLRGAHRNSRGLEGVVECPAPPLESLCTGRPRRAVAQGPVPFSDRPRTFPIGPGPFSTRIKCGVARTVSSVLDSRGRSECSVSSPFCPSGPHHPLNHKTPRRMSFQAYPTGTSGPWATA